MSEHKENVVEHRGSQFGCAVMILAVGIACALYKWAVQGFPGLAK